MSSIDERTVKMRFDNAGFKKAAVETQSSLANVDKAVANTGKGRGLLDMAGHMDTVRVKASAMQVAVITALANVVTKAVDAGLRLGKALTLDPFTQGFNEYELKIKSIQTILANTTGENLKSVTAALEELNTYADKTIYNFANMTTNIGKLTTAGIGLDDATAVVKGFHNMVALAGGDATAAAGAMEQFGQGLQAGKIMAIDWMSISTRGLGSQSLQKAFFETSRAMDNIMEIPVGQTFEEWSKTSGGFKASLEQGWLTADVATEALKIMTGDVKSVDELMAKGFSRDAAEDLLKIADNAVESATKVRTFTAFMGTLKEQIGSGFSQVLEVIIGDFNEATKMFTKWSDATGKVVGNIFGYLERLARGFEKFGGRVAFLQTLKNILSPIGAILGLIARGWTKAFGGGEAGRGIATLFKALQHITRPLRILGKLISGQLTPMEAWERLVTVMKNALRNFLSYVGKKVNLDEMFGKIPSGERVLQFIKDLAREVREAIEDVERLVEGSGKLTDVFDGFNMPDLGGIFGKDDSKIFGLAGALKNGVSQTAGLAEEKSGGMFNPNADISAGRVSDIPAGPDGTSLSYVAEGVKEEGEKLKTTGNVFMDIFGGFIDGVKNFFGDLNFEDLMASFNLAVLTTFMIKLTQMLDSFKTIANIGGSVSGVLDAVKDSIGSFQTMARAKLILAIGISIGILAVSLWLLSKIPFQKMLVGLMGLGAIMLIAKVGVDQIVKAVEAMDGKGTIPKLAAFSIALLALAAAVFLLTGAFLLMRFVRWEDLLKGLITIRVAMISMMQLGSIAEKGYKNILAGAFAIATIAGSMVVLAGALILFRFVKWEDMAKAGLVLVAITAALAGLAMIPNAELAKVGAAMLLTSAGMLILANALIIFGSVQWESIGKLAVVLGTLAITLGILMVVGNPVTIAGIVSLSFAMIGLATAALILNKVDWSSIGKLALILGILVIGVAAFLAVLTVFTPVLVILSAFAGSLALLAFAITALMIAFAAIAPIMAIGAAAFATFATGAAVAFAVFMTTLAAEAPILKKAVLDILQVIIDGFVEAIPMIMQGLRDIWAAIKKEVSAGDGGGQMNTLMGDSGKSWIEKLRDGILKKLPAIIDAGMQIIIKFISGIAKRARELAAKGVELVVNLIKGIGDKAADLASAAVDLVVKLAKGIGDNLPRLVRAGINLITDWLHALADGIRNGADKIGGGLKDVMSAIKDVGIDIVKGLIAGVEEMATDAINAIGDLAGKMVGKAKDILDIFSPSRVFKRIGKFLVEGLTNGIQENAVSAITAVASLVSGQIAVANEYISGFIQKLDQQAIAASAKAAGLASAAEAASRSADRAASRADKTKGKKDDRKANKAGKSADRLSDAAEKAAKKAEKAEAKAEKAREAQDRAAEFEKSDLLTKAQMRSEDAQMSMEEAKNHEFNAARNLAEAEALERQAGAKGVTKKDADKMRKEAERLRKQARKQAELANAAIEQARTFAGNALELQTQAGNEASLMFQQQYDQEAADDAAEDAFNKLTDAEKAVKRRQEAAALQAKADQQLADAKVLAYTDLEAANELAEQAMANAQQARDYLDEAASLEEKTAGGTGTSQETTSGRVVNTAITDAAGLIMQRANDRYSAATASAAGSSKVEFNQYNTSPESLNPSEVYRRTHNLLDTAGERILIPAA